MSISYQRVWPPLAAITAWTWSGILSTNFWISSSVTFSHSSKTAVLTWSLPLVLRLRILRQFLSSFQMFSIELRSGEYGGHTIEGIWYRSRCDWVHLALWAGAPSSINQSGWPFAWLSQYQKGQILGVKTWSIYDFAVIVPQLSFSQTTITFFL